MRKPDARRGRESKSVSGRREEASLLLPGTLSVSCLAWRVGSLVLVHGTTQDTGTGKRILASLSLSTNLFWGGVSVSSTDATTVLFPFFSPKVDGFQFAFRIQSKM